MSRIGYPARRYGLDAAIALLVVAGMLEVAFGRDSADAPRTTPWFTVPVIGLMVLPLAIRRRFPFAAPAAYWLLAVGVSFVDGRLVPFPESVYLVGVAISFLLGGVRDPLRARLGLAIVAGGSALVVHNLPGHSTSELLFIPLVFAVAWVAGLALRERAVQAEEAEDRAAQAEREREAAARLAVAEERARIARELHDVVAHAVSVMVLQVGAVRHKLAVETLDEDRQALLHVERAGRSALAEMRRLLGAMRRDGDDVELGPQPGLDGLASLLEDVGRAGLDVALHIEGERLPLPRGIDLSAYRIVQEALTNVLKHAHARRADVALRFRPGELELEILDDGAGPASANGIGHGLVGIRERVKIYGGELATGAAPAGGFVLTARLPIERRP